MLKRFDKKKPSGPLNAENFCSTVSAGLPRALELVNGWHGRARNSKGFEPPKEEIVDSAFVSHSEEYQAYSVSCTRKLGGQGCTALPT